MGQRRGKSETERVLKAELDTYLQEQLYYEVKRVGVLRRIWQARKWHGADWWLATISAAGLVFFIILGLFPSWFAPYDYNEEAGPSLLEPSQSPESYVMIVQTSTGLSAVDEIDDDAYDEEGNPVNSRAPRVGSIDEVASAAVTSLRDEGILVRPDRLRDTEPREALEALNSGQLLALVGSEREFLSLLDEYPDLEVLGSVGPEFADGYLMGTTQLGYDVFSRLIYGARTTLIIGISSALFSSFVGIPLGLLSGFLGGYLDRGLTLVMDSLYSFPGLILAIAIAAVLGPGIGNIILAIAVLYVPTYYRIVRGQTLAIKQELYVEAARSLGATRFVMLWRYVFPNVIASVVVIFSVNVADAILTGAGLSFLGLGLPPDTPDWGVDLAEGQPQLRNAWWLVTFPGLAIATLTLCFSLLGESLSEILNPRLNER